MKREDILPMKPDLSGKKLLILGAGAVETTLVYRAKELGIHTIVTDYNLDHRLSPAKDIADESWDISWSDIDALEKECRASGVDGVISGYSEFRVENNIKLCERLHFPCYITMEQLDVTRDKVKFKSVCRKNGVPVIREFPDIESVTSYPVIIKPTDRAGSIGISIANNHEELVAAYKYAMDMSVCKRVIIEEFIYKATKFDVYYAIIDGEILLLSSDDVLNAKSNRFEKVVQSGWLLPSIHHEAYIQNVDAAMRSMIRDMGIRNGYIFFSGFANGNGNFAFFECGFRLCGGHLYNYFPYIGQVNNMDLFIYYALTGDATCIKQDVCGGRPLKCVTINVYAKKGTIGEIRGFEELKALPSCYFMLQNAPVGTVCNEDKAILTKVGMAYFCSEHADELAADVQQMNQIVQVLDVDGNDMVYDRVDPSNIQYWWSNGGLEE